MSDAFPEGSDHPILPGSAPLIDRAIGRKKAKKPLSAQFIEAKAEKTARKKKCSDGCRLCPNEQGFRIEPHHIVRRGSPHFGTWDGRNILSLCLACHSAYHSGDEAIRSARVRPDQERRGLRLRELVLVPGEARRGSRGRMTTSVLISRAHLPVLQIALQPAGVLVGGRR